MGRAARYFTAGHHALVLKPTWEYGGSAYEATRGVGGIVEKIAPTLHNDAADTLDDGPWEEAGGESTTGELYFLKGDGSSRSAISPRPPIWMAPSGWRASPSDDCRAAVTDHERRSRRYPMSRRFRSLPLVLFSAFAAWGFGACGERASGETQAGASAAARPGRAAKTTCPTVEQVGEAAGFQVTFTQSIGSNPDTWMACQYEMTGRYRGNFLELTGEPASKADSVFAEMKRAVKGMKGDGCRSRQDRCRHPGVGLRLQFDERGGGRDRLARVACQARVPAGQQHRGPEGGHGPRAQAGRPLIARRADPAQAGVVRVAAGVAPLLAASLWLDAHGETATGSVTAKREEIHAENEPTGGWYSRRFLEVGHSSPGGRGPPGLGAGGFGGVRQDAAR